MRYVYIGSEIRRKDQPARLLSEVLDLDARRSRGDSADREWDWLMADIREHLGRPIGERL